MSPVWVSDDHVTYAWQRPWPHWRDSGYAELREQVEAPISDLLWHVARGYWRAEWGTQPDGSDAAVDAAREQLAGAPRLAPVYAHRYLPAAPYRSGHPVLSIWNGLDIVCYGARPLTMISRSMAGLRLPRPDDHRSPSLRWASMTFRR